MGASTGIYLLGIVFLSGWYPLGVSKLDVLASTLSSMITRETRSHAGVKPQKSHCKWWTLGVHFQGKGKGFACTLQLAWLTLLVTWIGAPSKDRSRLRGMRHHRRVCRCFSLYKRIFSGSMLVVQGVHGRSHWYRPMHRLDSWIWSSFLWDVNSAA